MRGCVVFVCANPVSPNHGAADDDPSGAAVTRVRTAMWAPGFDVFARPGDADDLLREVRAHKPDVAVVDIRMPPTHVDGGLWGQPRF